MVYRYVATGGDMEGLSVRVVVALAYSLTLVARLNLPVRVDGAARGSTASMGA
jgi:hypothetical protein